MGERVTATSFLASPIAKKARYHRAQGVSVDGSLSGEDQKETPRVVPDAASAAAFTLDFVALRSTWGATSARSMVHHNRDGVDIESTSAPRQAFLNLTALKERLVPAAFRPSLGAAVDVTDSSVEMFVEFTLRAMVPMWNNKGTSDAPRAPLPRSSHAVSVMPRGHATEEHTAALGKLFSAACVPFEQGGTHVQAVLSRERVVCVVRSREMLAALKAAKELLALPKRKSAVMQSLALKPPAGETTPPSFLPEDEPWCWLESARVLPSLVRCAMLHESPRATADPRDEPPAQAPPAATGPSSAEDVKKKSGSSRGLGPKASTRRGLVGIISGDGSPAGRRESHGERLRGRRRSSSTTRRELGGGAGVDFDELKAADLVDDETWTGDGDVAEDTEGIVDLGDQPTSQPAPSSGVPAPLVLWADARRRLERYALIVSVDHFHSFPVTVKRLGRGSTNSSVQAASQDRPFVASPLGLSSMSFSPTDIALGPVSDSVGVSVLELPSAVTSELDSVRRCFASQGYLVDVMCSGGDDAEHQASMRRRENTAAGPFREIHHGTRTAPLDNVKPTAANILFCVKHVLGNVDSADAVVVVVLVSRGGVSATPMASPLTAGISGRKIIFTHDTDFHGFGSPSATTSRQHRTSFLLVEELATLKNRFGVAPVFIVDCLPPFFTPGLTPPSSSSAAAPAASPLPGFALTLGPRGLGSQTDVGYSLKGCQGGLMLHYLAKGLDGYALMDQGLVEGEAACPSSPLVDYSGVTLNMFQLATYFVRRLGAGSFALPSKHSAGLGGGKFGLTSFSCNMQIVGPPASILLASYDRVAQVGSPSGWIGPDAFGANAVPTDLSCLSRHVNLSLKKSSTRSTERFVPGLDRTPQGQSYAEGLAMLTERLHRGTIESERLAAVGGTAAIHVALCPCARAVKFSEKVTEVHCTIRGFVPIAASVASGAGSHLQSSSRSNATSRSVTPRLGDSTAEEKLAPTPSSMSSQVVGVRQDPTLFWVDPAEYRRRLEEALCAYLDSPCFGTHAAPSSMQPVLAVRQLVKNPFYVVPIEEAAAGGPEERGRPRLPARITSVVTLWSAVQVRLPVSACIALNKRPPAAGARASAAVSATSGLASESARLAAALTDIKAKHFGSTTMVRRRTRRFAGLFHPDATEGEVKPTVYVNTAQIVFSGLGGRPVIESLLELTTETDLVRMVSVDRSQISDEPSGSSSPLSPDIGSDVDAAKNAAAGVKEAVDDAASCAKPAPLTVAALGQRVPLSMRRPPFVHVQAPQTSLSVAVEIGVRCTLSDVRKLRRAALHQRAMGSSSSAAASNLFLMMDIRGVSVDAAGNTATTSHPAVVPWWYEHYVDATIAEQRGPLPPLHQYGVDYHNWFLYFSCHAAKIQSCVRGWLCRRQFVAQRTLFQREHTARGNVHDQAFVKYPHWFVAFNRGKHTAVQESESAERTQLLLNEFQPSLGQLFLMWAKVLTALESQQRQLDLVMAFSSSHLPDIEEPCDRSFVMAQHAALHDVIRRQHRCLRTQMWQRYYIQLQHYQRVLQIKNGAVAIRRTLVFDEGQERPEPPTTEHESQANSGGAATGTTTDLTDDALWPNSPAAVDLSPAASKVTPAMAGRIRTAAGVVGAMTPAKAKQVGRSSD